MAAHSCLWQLLQPLAAFEILVLTNANPNDIM
jgi:hypothetical protein